MHRVAGRKLSISQNNLLRTLHHDAVHRQHLIDDTEQSVESWLNCVAAIDCNISVQDFLQDLGIGNQTLTVGDQLLEQTLRVRFVRMRCANQIHRDIGVDQNHGRGPVPYPASISDSMSLMSPTG